MFQIHYCDYHVSERDGELIYRPTGSGDYLFLYFATSMKVYREGQMEIARPGACVLSTPGEEQHYQAVKGFRNSYVHFDGPPGLGQRYGIPVNEVFYPCGEQETDGILARIHSEYLTRPEFYEEALDALMRQLMVCLGRAVHSRGSDNQEETDLFRRFRQARYQVLSECGKDWTTEQMARLVSLSRSQYYVYYERFFNRSPKADLIDARIEKAKNLLTNQALQVQQVGELCGFTSISHFNRYFKERCGCPPGAYAAAKRQEEKDNKGK